MSSLSRVTLSLCLCSALGCSASEDPAEGDFDTDSDDSQGASSTSANSDGSNSESGGTTAGTTGTDPTAGSSTGDDGDPTDDPTGAPTEPPFEDVRNYIFGHSLLLHSPTANVPRWLETMADSAGYSYAMSGQYGFADTHADGLPPVPQWGIEGVDSAWDEDQGASFADADFNTVLFTEANFRQYFPPTEPEPDLGGTTSVDSTLTVFDWVNGAETGVRYIIYENWPDMAPYTNADFVSSQPTTEELAAYWAFTAGDFHQWWVDYHDALRASRPDLTIHMVPVGPVLASLLTGPLSDIEPAVLYEDNAPHGRESLYFLAGLVTYMAVYAEPPPADYAIPADVDPRIAERYDEIVEDAWAAVLDFEDSSGRSRVFD